jgi:uncharacterized protein YbjQ (UPF0145 family)
MSAADLLAQNALQRLANLARPSKGAFTSDLSADEMVLLEDADFEPLHLVMGSCIYHIGFQWTAWTQSQELDLITGAMYEARYQAMSRMESEASQVGADGVVGVRIDVNHEHWGHGLAEFVAIGTAVKARRGQYRVTAAQRPFTSDLNCQDFYTLLRSGYRPLGLVMGVSVYHVARQGLGAFFGRISQNVELDNFTEAMYASRERAMTRMQGEAHGLGAEGIVGVRIEEKSHVWGGHTVEFFALGTAVRRLDSTVDLPKPAIHVPLDV